MQQSTAADKRRKGGVLVEATLCLPLVLLALILTSAIILSLWVKFCLYTDAHALARAHLYRNQKVLCRPSKQWPKTLRKHISMECNFRGNVEAKFHLESQSVLFWETPNINIHAGAMLQGAT